MTHHEGRGRWRTGRSIGRTVYVQLAGDPSKSDLLIGMMDTRDLADLVCKAVNQYLEGDPKKVLPYLGEAV